MPQFPPSITIVDDIKLSKEQTLSIVKYVSLSEIWKKTEFKPIVSEQSNVVLVGF